MSTRRSKPIEPILVERFRGDQSLRIICRGCGAEETIDPDDISNEALYNCPADCGDLAEYKYEEASKCPGCNKLGHWQQALDYCCSRVCKLQAEYGRSIGAIPCR